jgi:MFS family permease
MYLVTYGTSELGLQYWHWGLLSWAASMALAFQLASAWLIEHIGTRKWLWYTAALTARVLRGAAIVLSFLLVSNAPGVAKAVFIGLLVLASMCDAFAAPPWFSWLADIIPADEHGRFMGRRGAWIALANICVVIPVGFAVDAAPDGDKTPALMAVFALGFVLGVADLVIHRTIPEPPMKPTGPPHFWRQVRAPLRDRRFRPWLLFNACWTFSMTLGGSLATIYFVENLGIKRNFLGGSLVLIVVPLAATVVAGAYLGRLVDRHGIKPVLRWGHLFWALLPAFWLFATPRTALYWLGAGALISGLASSAAMNAGTKLVTRLPSNGRVAMYVAVSTCVGSFAGGLGGLAAGLLLQLFRDAEWQIAGLTVVGFHVLFGTSMLLRLGSTLLLHRIHEPQARSTTPGKTARARPSTP